MKYVSYLVTVLLLSLMILSCDKTTKTKPDTCFSLNIEVVDTLGNALPNYDIVLYPYFGEESALLNNASREHKLRLNTTIPINFPDLASDSISLKLDIYDVDNNHIWAITKVTSTQNNFCYLYWNGNTELSTQISDGVYKAILTVLTPGIDTSTWNDTIWMWVLKYDPVGQTDSHGKLTITDRKLFPSFYNIPPMDLTDYNNSEIESDYSFTQSTYIETQNPEHTAYSYQSVNYVDGPNFYKLIWIPIVPSSTDAKIEKYKSNSLINSNKKESHRFLYGLQQNFPNPF